MRQTNFLLPMSFNSLTTPKIMLSHLYINLQHRLSSIQRLATSSKIKSPCIVTNYIYCLVVLKQLFGQEFDLALLRHLPASVVGKFQGPVICTV